MLAMVTCGSDPVRDGVAAPEAADANEANASDAGASEGGVCPGLVFAGWSDGMIAALLEANDQAEVSLAQTVRAGLGDPEVVAFAEKTITNHTLLGLQAEGAARADAIAVVPSGESVAIAAQEGQAAQGLARLAWESLDCAYMEHEVLVHLQELSWLDRIACPDVRDVRLAAIVQATRAIASTHATLAVRALESAMEENNAGPRPVLGHPTQ